MCTLVESSGDERVCRKRCAARDMLCESSDRKLDVRTEEVW